MKLVLLLASVFSLSAAEFTYNSDKGTLTWKSADGKKSVINYNNLKMTVGGKPQTFSKLEALQWLNNLWALEQYCRESEKWHKDPAAYQRQHEREHDQEAVPRQSKADPIALKK